MRCPYKRNGCKWEGDLGNLDHHSKSCSKRPWQCQHCDFIGTYDIGTTNHLPNCTKYPEPCPNQCDIGTVPRCDMEKHLTECQLQLVECEFAHAGCRERIPRQELSHHMKEGAQHHLLSMSLLNLSLTRELHQKMAEKDQQIAELQGQLREQSRKLEEQGKQREKQLHKIETEFQCQQQELIGQQKVTEKQISGIQTRLAEKQLQKMDNLQEQFRRETANLQQQLVLQLNVVEKGWEEQSSKLEDQVEKIKVLEKQTEKRLQKHLETGLTGLQHQLDLQGKLTEKQQQQTRRLEEQFQEIKLIGQQTEKQLQKQVVTGLSRLQGQIQMQDEKVTDLQQQMKLIVGMQEKFESKLTVQRSELANLSKQISMQTQLLRENRVLQTALEQQGDNMQSLVQEGHASVLGLYPTFEFTITKFSVHRAKRRRGLWESDSFYSHHRGYKFHLSIDTNGYEEAEGTHITADLCLHDGEYDDKLSWPFYITAHLQLLNQWGGHGHVVASLNTTVNEDDEYIEIARKFIAHSELRYNAAKGTQYLYNDCLHFRLYLKVTCKA